MSNNPAITYPKSNTPIDPSKDWFRHRKEADYVVKGLKIYRMGDGLCAYSFTSFKSVENQVNKLRRSPNPMRVKYLDIS